MFKIVMNCYRTNLFIIFLGEFDDLISALRTGDVFDKDMAQLNQKRNRRRVSNTNGNVKSVGGSRERVGSLANGL